MGRKAKKQLKKIKESQTYEEYVRKYEVRKKTMAKQKIRMNMPKYTKSQWERQVFLAREEQPELVDINSYLVDRATYKYTEKQAAAYRKAAKIQEEDIAYREIRLGLYEAENFIENMRDKLVELNIQLLEEGIDSGTERKMIIGATFFGSI